jgi:hypothetical protein
MPQGFATAWTSAIAGRRLPPQTPPAKGYTSGLAKKKQTAFSDSLEDTFVRSIAITAISFISLEVPLNVVLLAALEMGGG